jgi:hypothetical protein
MTKEALKRSYQQPRMVIDEPNKKRDQKNNEKA